MNANESNADETETEFTIDFSGATRTHAEMHAQAAFTGDDLADEVFGRYSTVVAVRSVDECNAVISILDQISDDLGHELQAGQKRVIRRVRRKLVEARAEFRSVDADDEDEDDEDDESEDEADDWEFTLDDEQAESDDEDDEAARPRVATDDDEAEDLLASLDEGDRIEVGGDEWKVIDTSENSRGTPFVECRSLTGYHPGTTTFKPSARSTVSTHGRGVGTAYNRVEVLGDEDDEQAEDDDEDEREVRADGGEPVDAGRDPEGETDEDEAARTCAACGADLGDRVGDYCSTDCSLDDRNGGEYAARREAAQGEATLALDAAQADEPDDLTAPFTALDVSATDVFAVEVDGRRLVTETFRVACDGSFTVESIGPGGRVEGRRGEALERIERIEWFGALDE